jgi:uncharacterized membrane protein
MERFRHCYDLLGALALCALQAVLVFSGVSGPIRVANGFLFVALLPGYSLLAAVYRPFRPDLAPLEHMVLAMPVSLAMDVALGLLLNNLGWSVQPERQVIWLSVVIALPALAALWQRRAGQAKVGGWIGGSRGGAAWHPPVLALLVCLALGLGLVSRIVASPTQAPSVSLSLLDAAGQDTSYPVDVARGATVRVQVAVALQGGMRRSFVLTSPGGTPRTIALAPGQTWRRTVAVRVRRAGVQRLSWTLTGGSGRLRRSVHLWIRGR